MGCINSGCCQVFFESIKELCGCEKSSKEDFQKILKQKEIDIENIKNKLFILLSITELYTVGYCSQRHYWKFENLSLYFENEPEKTKDNILMLMEDFQKEIDKYFSTYSENTIPIEIKSISDNINFWKSISDIENDDIMYDNLMNLVRGKKKTTENPQVKMKYP